MARILYISYDGMTSHIGEAQVLPYLRRLTARGHQFSLVSFEQNPHASKASQLMEELNSIGIDWHPRQFRSRPPIIAKLIDQVVLRNTLNALVSSNRYDLVHSRSYIAASAGVRVTEKIGIPHLFDMRGFWVDQRLEGNRWPSTSLFYRWLYWKWKRRERQLLQSSSAAIVLTAAAKNTLFEWGWDKSKPCAIIPCSYHHHSDNEPNSDRRAKARAILGIKPEETVLVYLGSLGSVYMLLEMLSFYASFRSRFGRTRFFFLGSTDREFILGHAKQNGLEIEEDEFIFLRCETTEVHSWLNAGDAAICFISPTFSSRGVSPTKLAEYLAIGLPTVANSQVGDVADIINNVPNGGVIVEDFNEKTLDEAAMQLASLIPTDRMALRRKSQGIHDMEISIDAFDSLYAEIIDKSNNE